MKTRGTFMAIVFAMGIGLVSAQEAKAALAAPTGLSVTAGIDTLSITWNAVSGATSYRIYTTSDCTGSAKSSATNSYTFSTSGNTASYGFTVRGVTSKGSLGVCSNPSSPMGSTVLAAPTGLSITRAVNAFTITWNAVSNASSYQLFRAAGDCSGRATKVSGTSYTMTGTLRTEYNFSVRAVTAKRNLGVCSSEPGARYVLPAAPTLRSVTIGKDGSTRKVSWSNVSGATYTVYRSTTASDSGFQSLASGLSATTSYVETSACPGAVCYYKVVASAHGDNSADSNVVSSWTPVSPGGGAPTLSLGSGFADQSTANLGAIVDGVVSGGLPQYYWSPPSYASPNNWSAFDGEIIYDYGTAKTVSYFELANTLTCGSTLNVTIYRYAAGSWTQIATGSYSFASVLSQSSTINFTQATDTKFKVRFATTCPYSSYWGFSIYEAKLN